MQIVIDIPDEQIKKSLEESKYINEDEGEKGSVHITMLYTNAQLEFVDVERKTDFYSCEYRILSKGHGRLIDADKLLKNVFIREDEEGNIFVKKYYCIEQKDFDNTPTIIEADKTGGEGEDDCNKIF